MDPNDNPQRAAFMDSLTSFPAQVRSVGSEDLEIHVWGDIAVVTGLQSAQIELADGQEKVDMVTITNVFQQQGRWVLKLAHAIALEQSGA